jgi:hypothetical protein
VALVAGVLEDCFAKTVVEVDRRSARVLGNVVAASGAFFTNFANRLPLVR